MELVALVVELPAGTTQCDRCHRPARLDTAVTLAEDHLPARPMGVAGAAAFVTTAAGGSRATATFSN